MKIFKTPKGTELPLMELKGKDYLQVAYRLVWFREEKPLWGIETVVGEGLSKAIIKDETGRIIATAHKTVGTKVFAEESSETGAIGRALAMCGFGTQFCGDELDEKEDLADAPVQAKKIEEQRVISQNKGIQETGAAKKSPEVQLLDTPPLTEAQLATLDKVQERCGWKEEKLRAYLIQNQLNPDKSKLTSLQYRKLISAIKAWPEKGFAK